MCDISGSHVFERFLILEDKSPEGPPQPDSSSEISAEDGLDVPVGNSACSFPTTMLGKHRFRVGFFHTQNIRVFVLGKSAIAIFCDPRTPRAKLATPTCDSNRAIRLQIAFAI